MPLVLFSLCAFYIKLEKERNSTFSKIWQFGIFTPKLLFWRLILRVISPEIEKAYPTDCIDILLPIKDWPNNTKEKESGENKLFLGRSISSSSSLLDWNEHWHWQIISAVPE